MSLFTYDYGLLEPIAAQLTDTSVVVLYAAEGNQVVIHNIRAALTGASATTTLVLDVFDGTTAYEIRGAKVLDAHEVYFDTVPIVLETGWSLRATRGAGDPVHITGLAIVQV